MSYTIGRTLGLGFIHRYGRWFHVSDEQIRRVHDWFNRIGHWALFLGYYIPGVRHFSAIVAGTSKLEFRAFATYAWGGALVWVCTFVAIGYSLGEQWQKVFEVIDRNIRLVGLGALAVVLLYAVWRFWKSKRR